MTCSENVCTNGIDFQCPYCESDYCQTHIDNHSFCDVIEGQITEGDKSQMIACDFCRIEITGAVYPLETWTRKYQLCRKCMTLAARKLEGMKH